jgi:DMSO/TMAO reductase YedYZ molybdopterin-dependent catalytic subunit
MPLTNSADAKYLIKDAAKLVNPSSRRAFLKHAFSLGSLALLTGCDVTTDTGAEVALKAVSKWNDKVQAWLFSENRLAQEFPESAITDPFPFNAFYKEDDAPEVEEADFELSIGGKIEREQGWALAELRALPQVSQVTQHICIEGWSAIGKWSGIRFSDFLARVGADTRAKYVTFRCADAYSTSIDMATALHPQTQLTLRFRDEELPRKYGFPMKLRVPTKLGFKNPKHITEIVVGDDYTGGFWENYGYNWFSGL